MLITTTWYGRSITYDNEKYYHKETEDNLSIYDKKTNTIIFKSIYPIIIKQITNNEFIVADIFSKKLDYQCILQHIQYDEENHTPKTIYEKKYQSKNIIGEVRNINDLFIMESYTETTIYNPKARKSLTLKDCQIEEQPSQLQNEYLIMRTNIDNKDYLTMYLNPTTLEPVQLLYSRLQDRIIPIIQKPNKDFITNYQDTVQNEVIKYIKLLEQIELDYNQQSDSKAIQILRKSLKTKK